MLFSLIYFTLRGSVCLFDDGKMAHRIVEFVILGTGNGLTANFPKPAQIFRILWVGDDGGMPGTFVDDVGGRGVFYIFKLANVRSDYQNIIGLELHKGRGRDKTVHRYGGPAN